VTQSEWIHDWNSDGPMAIRRGTRALLNDETLRDGLQNPSIQDPTIEEKIEILHLMESLRIDSVNIGLPGAGPRAMQHVEALAREIATNRMRIRPNCAARTVEARRNSLISALKPISARLRKSRSVLASRLKRQRFWAPAPSAGWLRIGRLSTYYARQKRP
jgi:2-isopropylmalate synthase